MLAQDYGDFHLEIIYKIQRRNLAIMPCSCPILLRMGEFQPSYLTLESLV